MIYKKQLSMMVKEITLQSHFNQVKLYGRKINVKDKVFRILKVVFFIFCMFLVINGQRTIGKLYLLSQLIGLAGLLFRSEERRVGKECRYGCSLEQCRTM